jgi:hypothetical protein
MVLVIGYKLVGEVDADLDIECFFLSAGELGLFDHDFEETFR